MNCFRSVFLLCFMLASAAAMAGSPIPVTDRATQAEAKAIEEAVRKTSALLGEGLSAATNNQTAAISASLSATSTNVVEAIRALPLAQEKMENARQYDPALNPKSPVSCARVKAVEVYKQIEELGKTVEAKVDALVDAHNAVKRIEVSEQAFRKAQAGTVMSLANEENGSLMDALPALTQEDLGELPGSKKVESVKALETLINPFPAHESSYEGDDPAAKAKAVVFNSRLALATKLGTREAIKDLTLIKPSEEIKDWLKMNGLPADADVSNISESGLRTLINTWRKRSMDWIKYTEADAKPIELQRDANMMMAQMLANQEQIIQFLRDIAVTNALVYGMAVEGDMSR